MARLLGKRYRARPQSPPQDRLGVDVDRGERLGHIHQVGSCASRLAWGKTISLRTKGVVGDARKHLALAPGRASCRARRAGSGTSITFLNSTSSTSS